MTNWHKKKIDLANVFKKYNTGKITIEKAGTLTAEKILKIRGFAPNLVKKFSKVQTENQYNKLLNTLYDYGDLFSIWIEH
mgnify:CR=1 FL=1